MAAFSWPLGINCVIPIYAGYPFAIHWINSLLFVRYIFFSLCASAAASITVITNCSIFCYSVDVDISFCVHKYLVNCVYIFKHNCCFFCCKITVVNNRRITLYSYFHIIFFLFQTQNWNGNSFNLKMADKYL